MSVCPAVAEDDVAVLDMVSRQGGDLSQPRPITGSQMTASHSQDYTPEGERFDDPIPQCTINKVTGPCYDDHILQCIIC